MTDVESTAERPRTGVRRATIRTTHEDPEVIAAALDPDNTTEMTTQVAVDNADDTQVVTAIERESTGGLRSTVDDYVVNLSVADRVAQTAKHTTDTTSNDNA